MCNITIAVRNPIIDGHFVIFKINKQRSYNGAFRIECGIQFCDIPSNIYTICSVSWRIGRRIRYYRVSVYSMQIMINYDNYTL